MRWALVPHYHKGSLAEYKPILNNCRVETIEEKTTFKVPLRNGKRCVILAEGYVLLLFYLSLTFTFIFIQDFLNGKKMFLRHRISFIKIKHLLRKNIIQMLILIKFSMASIKINFHY